VFIVAGASAIIMALITVSSQAIKANRINNLKMCKCANDGKNYYEPGK